jgi:hypothetical protein
MPNIYLKHPDHGTKIAFMEEEAIFDEESGWTRYTPGDPSEPAIAGNQLVNRRRGRRPANEGLATNDDSRRSD